jgi:hypothetical protein
MVGFFLHVNHEESWTLGGFLMITFDRDVVVIVVVFARKYHLLLLHTSLTILIGYCYWGLES